jgi:hypothetical protein
VIADMASGIRQKCACSLRSDGATVEDQLCVAFPRVHKGRPNGPAATTAVASGACLASVVYKHSSAPNGGGGWRMVRKTRQANRIWFVHSEFAHQFDRACFAQAGRGEEDAATPFGFGLGDLGDGGGGNDRGIDRCAGSGRAGSVRRWVKIKNPRFSMLVVDKGRWMTSTSGLLL